MKKVILVITVLAMILFSVAFSESMFGVDLTSLSIEDLTALRKAVTDELISRGTNSSSELYSGHYIVGKQIPEGGYLITAVDTRQGSNVISICYETEDDRLIRGITLRPGWTYYLEVEAPNYIKVSDGSITLTSYNPDYPK